MQGDSLFASVDDLNLRIRVQVNVSGGRGSDAMWRVTRREASSKGRRRRSPFGRYQKTFPDAEH